MNESMVVLNFIHSCVTYIKLGLDYRIIILRSIEDLYSWITGETSAYHQAVFLLQHGPKVVRSYQ